jgi:hypothetical protein
LNIPFLIADYGNKEVEQPDVGVDMKNAIAQERCHLVITPEELRQLNSRPKLPCGHDGPEDQVDISKWWISKIYNQFQTITAIPHRTFLTLDNCTNQKMGRLNPAWFSSK